MAENIKPSTSNTDENPENNSTPTLTINLNEEYKIKIEDSSELGKSFFKDIYLKAAKATADIIEQSKANNKKEDDNPKDTFLNQEQEYNNIIAFVGERGTGKSSAMITFAKSLIEAPKAELYQNDDKTKQLSSVNYESLEVIDPSLFEKGENIFEVVLAQMFSKFHVKLKDNQQDKGLNDKRKVLELFEKVYENLQTIKKNGEKYDGEALETLHKLACGANLRKNFKELVSEYVAYLKPDDKGTYLIIPIDDFDLNVKAVTEMAEQIRKYLMIPRVIILMAANIDQLADAKEQAIRDDFETLIEADRLREDPREIAIRYLLKLIPGIRRLNLPQIDEQVKKTLLKIIPIDSIGESAKESVSKEGKDLTNEEETKNSCWKTKEKNIEEYILGLIYKRTGLIFLAKENEKHFLVPTNLRKLKEVILFLTKSLSEEKSRENFYRFRDYIYLNYISDHLNKEQLSIVKKFINANVTEKNKLVIDEIRNLILRGYVNSYNVDKEPNDGLLFYFIEEPEIKEILQRLNSSVNVSIRDVLYFLNLYSRSVNDQESKLFVKALKVVYSLALYELMFVNVSRENARILCGESIVPSYIPTSKKLARARNDFEISLDQVIFKDKKLEEHFKELQYSDKYNRAIEVLTYMLPYFGSNYRERRKEDTAFFIRDVVINYNIINERFVHYDIFSFLTAILNPFNHIRRFAKDAHEEYLNNSSYMYKEFESYQNTYDCLSPLFSIDLIELVFEENFNRVKYYDSDEVETLYGSQIAILKEVQKRLGAIQCTYLNSEEIKKSFGDFPIVKEFNNENSDLKELYDSIFNNLEEVVSFENRLNSTSTDALNTFRSRLEEHKNSRLSYVRDEVVEKMRNELSPLLNVNELKKVFSGGAFVRSKRDVIDKKLNELLPSEETEKELNPSNIPSADVDMSSDENHQEGESDNKTAADEKEPLNE